jgi:type II secretory pathway component PulL
MPWWGTVLFLAAVVLAIWGFLSIVGFRTRTLTRKTDRRAEDLYAGYAGPQRRRHHYLHAHGVRRDHDEPG